MWIVRGRRTTQRSRRLRAYWIAAAASLLACATLQVLAISANSDRIAEARKLLRAGDYARVESTARALIEEAGSTGGAGPDSVEAARGIDLLVTALVRAGRSREPGTGELAQRAVASWGRTIPSWP
jgi:hypothetical protein